MDAVVKVKLRTANFPKSLLLMIYVIVNALTHAQLLIFKILTHVNVSAEITVPME